MIELGWVYMKDAVMNFMKKHQLIKKNSTVLLGVSGGADSLALLHFYVSLQQEWQLQLIVLSMDHQLRGEQSKEDLEYVKKICEAWGVAFEGTSRNVSDYARQHRISTQVAAREVRYQFFLEKMQKYQADFLALGHHGDDQVETMLMGLVRSSNPSALSGIPVKRPFASGWIVRPFLCVTKEMIYGYCKTHQIMPREDPSNEDIDYTRNYFRKYIIPIIKEKNNNIHTTIQRLSESLQEDDQYLRAEAKKLVQEVMTFNDQQKEISFNIDLFVSYPSALQRRAYHLILSYLYDHVIPENLSYVHEELFFDVLRHEQSYVQLDFPRQLRIEKSYKTLYLSFKKDKHYPLHHLLHIPGEVILPDGSKIIATITNVPITEDKYVYVYPLEEVTLPLVVRTRQKGDRMSWKGLKGSKKIKDIFIDAKIPHKERDTWPIVTDNQGNLLWLIGLKKGGLFSRETISDYDTFIQLKFIKGNIGG